MQSPMKPQGPLQQGPAQQYYNQPQQNQPKSQKRSFNIFRNLGHTRGLLVLVAVLQIILIAMVGLNISPLTLIQNYQNQQIVNEVATKTTINTAESPVIATITNADQLRSQNAAQAQVYKDAQSGDYVLGYSDKMIIYRRGEGKIVYEGDNPTDLVTHTQEKIIADISDKAKQAGVIPQDSKETPQISIITDIKSLQASNPKFYNVGRNNDIVALFPEAQVIVLYNQETTTIVNSGKYSTNIDTSSL